MRLLEAVKRAEPEVNIFKPMVEAILRRLKAEDENVKDKYRRPSGLVENTSKE